MSFEKVEFGKREIADISLFESLASGQTGMAVFNGPTSVSPGHGAAIGTNTNEQRAEFDRLLTRFAETASDELRARSESLIDQQGATEYRNIVSVALGTAVESLKEIQLERSGIPRFEEVIKKFGNTLQSAEVATARPKLNMARTTEIIADLRRRLEL